MNILGLLELLEGVVETVDQVDNFGRNRGTLKALKDGHGGLKSSKIVHRADQFSKRALLEDRTARSRMDALGPAFD